MTNGPVVRDSRGQNGPFSVVYTTPGAPVWTEKRARAKFKGENEKKMGRKKKLTRCGIILQIFFYGAMLYNKTGNKEQKAH